MRAHSGETHPTWGQGSAEGGGQCSVVSHSDLSTWAALAAGTLVWWHRVGLGRQQRLSPGLQSLAQESCCSRVMDELN